VAWHSRPAQLGYAIDGSDPFSDEGLDNAFLRFGYGFSVLMQKVKATQKHPHLFYTWRMALLFLIAVFNSAIYYGHFLKDYVMGGNGHSLHQ
jgi:hypothetical protein